MSRDCTRTTLELSCDERLVSGIGGAVAHHAERVGLNEATRDALVSALEDFCRQTLPLMGAKGDRLSVAIEEFDDRMEIVVEHHGDAVPSVGMDTFLMASASQSANGVSRVCGCCASWTASNMTRETAEFARRW